MVLVWKMIVVLSWLALLVRLADLRHRRDPAAVWLCVGLAGLAPSITMQLGPVQKFVDGHTALSVDVTLANLLIIIFVLGMNSSFTHQMYPAAEATRRVRRWLWAAVTAGVAVLLLAVTTPNNYAEFLAKLGTPDQVTFTSPTAYLYTGYYVVSSVGLVITALRLARIADRFSARLGLRVFATGGVLGILCGLLRLAAMIDYNLGGHHGVLQGPLVGLLYWAAIVLIFLSAVIPLLDRAAAR
ncbi:hypothetical protein D5S17_15795 [Pseudonocardiaceae bacterium YIM PH 21723]|nr:hypothetical protein D5S17_15795 [Pseudonocardiaceae bacterium YIM PH 21723]